LLRDNRSEWRARQRHARYLAIRVVIALDKYVENCADVATDDGLSQGQRNADGYLEEQVALPPAPTFPQDLDWKSIDHELAYRLLSLSNEAETANRMIGFASENSFPPDFEEVFEERQYQYAKLGLATFALTQELREKYDIHPQKLGEWNPVEHLTKAKDQVEEYRRDRAQRLAASPSLI
jgi:hypothetical protein